MKIAIASSGLGHVARGNESWAEDLGHALARFGKSVVLCKGAGEVEHAHERVIKCWRREQPRTSRLLRAIPRGIGWRLGLGSPYEVEQSTFAIGLIDLLRRERIDVLHSQDPIVAIFVQRLRKMGVVKTRSILAHGTEEPPEFLRQVDFLQHLAPWHLEQARVRGLWKSTWTAIPNFVDPEIYRPGRSDGLREELSIPRDALVVLCAAAIRRPHKRIDHLIREFDALREKSPLLPVWLVIAGGWEKDSDALIQEGRALLGDRVRFLVRFPRKRMADLYRASDLFVLCSLSEMLGIVLLEASASGLPCLVHHHPILEWVTGQGGRSVEMDRPGVLSSAMLELLSNVDLRRSMGLQARKYSVDHFGRDRVVDQILDYYSFVVGEKSTQGCS